MFGMLYHVNLTYHKSYNISYRDILMYVKPDGVILPIENVSLHISMSCQLEVKPKKSRFRQ